MKIISITKVVIEVVEEGGSSAVFGSGNGRWIFCSSSNSGSRIFRGSSGRQIFRGSSSREEVLLFLASCLESVL